MRISDCSSYVCSSDLQRTAHRITSPWKWRHLKSVIVPSVQSPPSMLKLHDFCNRASQAISMMIVHPVAVLIAPVLQIGRASCRERVCQYVYISVVAVSLNNKNKTTSRNLHKV